MKLKLWILVAVALNGLGQPAPQTKRISAGQAAYVVAIGSETRSLAHASSRLDVERRAKTEFAKRKAFHIAPSVPDADFAFVVIVDDSSGRVEEIALALWIDDYIRLRNTDVDQLRVVAFWQGSPIPISKRRAASAVATVGWSELFRESSVARGLVADFHKQNGFSK